MRHRFGGQPHFDIITLMFRQWWLFGVVNSLKNLLVPNKHPERLKKIVFFIAAKLNRWKPAVLWCHSATALEVDTKLHSWIITYEHEIMSLSWLEGRWRKISQPVFFGVSGKTSMTQFWLPDWWMCSMTLLTLFIGILPQKQSTLSVLEEIWKRNEML